MKLQLQTKSTCVPTPRKPKLYVAMADASNDISAFPDPIKSILRACSERKLS